MQIKQKKSYKKVIVILLFATAIAAGALYWYVFAQSGTNNDTSDNKEQDPKKTALELDKNPDQQSSASDQKQNIVTDSDTPTKPSSPDSITVTLSANNKNGDIYQLRYLIQQPVSEGTCTLVLTKGSSSITKTTPVQFLSSYSTCQGFDIPTRELESGKWQAVLSVKSGSSSGSTTHEINL